MERLSDLAHRKDVWTQCVLCTHYARWRLVDLQNRVGYDASLLRVIGRLRCSNCGTYSATFRFRQPESDLRLIERYRRST